MSLPHRRRKGVVLEKQSYVLFQNVDPLTSLALGVLTWNVPVHVAGPGWWEGGGRALGP